jgi:RNA recognition motif-containing protein
MSIPNHQTLMFETVIMWKQIPFNCQWQDLKDLFRNAGNILRADIAQGQDGRSRGFGTVLYATPEDARNAVGKFNML